MEFDGIDPDRMRDLGAKMTVVTEEMDTLISLATRAASDGWLDDMAGPAARTGAELLEELLLLADFARQKADDIEAAAHGEQSTPDDSAISRLEQSLNDGIGADGLDGSTKDAETLAAVQKWIKANPKCSAIELRKKMEEMARAGNQAAIDELSRALWARIGAMKTPAEIERYLGELGQSALVLAVESVGFPPGSAANGMACEAVSAVYTRLASQAANGGYPTEAMGAIDIYLMHRFGVDVRSGGKYAEAAAGRLLEASSRDDASAIAVTNAIVDDPFAANPQVGALLRTILKENPSVLGAKAGSAVLAQKIADIVASGATEAELAELQQELAQWTAEKIEKGEGVPDAIMAFGTFFNALANAGHGVGYNWNVLFDVIAKGLDTRLGGVADLILDLVKAVKPDNTYSDAASADEKLSLKRAGSLMILAFSNPQAAKDLAWALKYAADSRGDNSGKITGDLWGHLDAWETSEEAEDMTEAQKEVRRKAIDAAKTALGDIVAKFP